MAAHPDPTADADAPMSYQIRIRGRLGGEWAGWLGCVRIAPGGHGETLLISAPIDQAALFGLLKKIRDLGLPLCSVSPVQPGSKGVGR